MMMLGLETGSSNSFSLLLTDVCQCFKMKPINDFSLAVSSGAHLFCSLSTSYLV